MSWIQRSSAFMRRRCGAARAQAGPRAAGRRQAQDAEQQAAEGGLQAEDEDRHRRQDRAHRAGGIEGLEVPSGRRADEERHADHHREAERVQPDLEREATGGSASTRRSPGSRPSRLAKHFDSSANHIDW